MGCTPETAEDDCESDEYCKVMGCAATGRCAKKPAITNVATSVCGCDNVTYWNETVAASYGMNVKATGECPALTAKKCGGVGNTKCPEGRSCNFAVGVGGCLAPNIQGTCYGLPPTCVQTSGRLTQCGSSGSAKSCISACAAIKDEKPFFSDVTCP